MVKGKRTRMNERVERRKHKRCISQGPRDQAT
jgi:hypothetical protein